MNFYRYRIQKRYFRPYNTAVVLRLKCCSILCVCILVSMYCITILPLASYNVMNIYYTLIYNPIERKTMNTSFWNFSKRMSRKTKNSSVTFFGRYCIHIYIYIYIICNNNMLDIICILWMTTTQH